MRILSSLVSFVTLALFCVSCVSDKTVEEFKGEKQRAKQEQFKMVAGVYTGIVRSRQDNSVLGAMQIDFQARINAGGDPSKPGGDASTGSPVLIASVTFLDRGLSRFSVTSGFYDPDTGAYSAQIGIARASGSIETIDINAAFSSDSFSGQISTLRSVDFGGNFTLNRGGGSLADLLNQARPQKPVSAEDDPSTMNFQGETIFANQAKRALRFLVIQPLRGTAEDFLDLISPVRGVQVSLNYSPTLHLSFSNALLDSRQGLLTAEGSWLVDGRNQGMNLQCQGSIKAVLTCDHVTSAGTTARTSVQMSVDKLTDPPEAANENESIVRSYIGRGKFRDSIKEMKLTVTRLSKGKFGRLLDQFFLYSEKLVNVTIAFTADTTVSFTDIKFDSSANLIDGSMNVGGVQGYVAYVKCKAFKFEEKPSSDFSCEYSTSRSEPIYIDFKYSKPIGPAVATTTPAKWQ